MIHIREKISCVLLIMAFTSCKESYRPDIISSSESYLVVEGVLNAAGPTTINITKTAPLDSNDYRGVANALVTVEGKDNNVKSLMQSASGVYTSPGLSLIFNNEYRLRIKTNDGKEYLSDYVTVRQTPPIDSVSWKRDETGVNLYMNTHDPSNNTRYYLWNYDETWEINSYYYSGYVYIGGGIVRQRVLPDEQVYQCWKYNSSRNILVGSSAKLESDIISAAPIAFIERGNEKLAVRYSILLRQYALDKPAYEFYELMKKNTESLGTIFDAQPTEIRGNIKCITDPSELVIGYVTASNVQEKRTFIEHNQVPDWGFMQSCPTVTVKNNHDSIVDAYEHNGLSPYDAQANPGAPPGAAGDYLSSWQICVECPKRGGSTSKPVYW